MSESEVHKLAKTMMLRDLHGHLNDWEEGKYTYLDMSQVAANVNGIFINWEHYLDAATSQLAAPKQLPLFPEDMTTEQLREEHGSEIDEQYYDPPGTGSVGVNF